MDRLTQSIRHYVNAVIDFIDLVFPLSAAQLLWGLGAVAVIVPATAYAWWRHDSAAVSQAASEQTPHHVMPHIKQAVSPDVTTHLSADTNSSGTPSGSVNSGQVSSHNQANIQLHVNGQAIPVPPQGTVHKEISSQNGKTSVDLSVNSATSGTSQSHSQTSMNIEMNSSTNSQSTGGD